MRFLVTEIELTSAWFRPAGAELRGKVVDVVEFGPCRPSGFRSIKFSGFGFVDVLPMEGLFCSGVKGHEVGEMIPFSELKGGQRYIRDFTKKNWLTAKDVFIKINRSQYWFTPVRVDGAFIPESDGFCLREMDGRLFANHQDQEVYPIVS